MNNSLQVFVERQPVGILFQENENFIFRYDLNTELTKFISLTMSVRMQDYTHRQLHPLFEMHLPEGYLLAVIKRHFAKLVSTDDFGLLHLLAPSVRGRLHYRVLESSAPSLQLQDLLQPAHEGLFDELVQRFALHSPISGVQPKVVAKVLNKATLKLEDYIVKAWGPDYPELALNEYWCMRALQEAGVPVPEFYLSSDASLFIMKRFDITQAGEYLGFEDICVLQAKSREQKYEGSYERLTKTIASFVSPQHKAASMQQFFKMMVLNRYLQNGDAHLKNFGLLYKNAQDVWMAPAYDVVSTTAYIKEDIPALTLAGSRKWWSQRNLFDFGTKHCGLTLKQVSTLYVECETAMIKVAKQIEKALHETIKPAQRTVLQHLIGLFLFDR